MISFAFQPKNKVENAKHLVQDNHNRTWHAKSST